MRAWELMEKPRLRRTPITIRGLHQQKKEDKQRLASEKKRKALVPIMYGDSQWEREILELERMRLELDQLRAEIAATDADTKANSRDKISDMARSGIKAEDHSEQKIAVMAKRGLGRRKKRFAVS